MDNEWHQQTRVQGPGNYGWEEKLLGEKKEAETLPCNCCRCVTSRRNTSGGNGCLRRSLFDLLQTSTSNRRRASGLRVGVEGDGVVGRCSPVQEAPDKALRFLAYVSAGDRVGGEMNSPSSPPNFPSHN